MGWGWLCCAKKQGFVAGFPQILGFFRLLDLKKKPLQNFHFATAPFFAGGDEGSRTPVRKHFLRIFSGRS